MKPSFVYEPAVPWPSNVRALVTARSGGVSVGGCESFNLAVHVEDDPKAVAANRFALEQYLVGSKPMWLKQVHGLRVVDLDAVSDFQADQIEADGSITAALNKACAVLTADCLPILLASSDGSQVAAVHAGWRGLADGILGRAINAFVQPAQDLIAYLGPGISQLHYEVGGEVIDQVLARGKQFSHQYLSTCSEQTKNSFADALEGSFTASLNLRPNKFQLDLYAIAKAQLTALGVQQIYGGDYCTFSDDRWYSHRQNPQGGRFASLIWKIS